MVRRVLTSPLLTLGLFVALLVSLWRSPEEAPRVVGFEVSGPDTTPTLRIDVNKPLASADGIELEPMAPLRAKLVSPYRIEVRPERPLERFRRYELRLPIRTGRPLTFRTGSLGLVEPPRTRVRWSGDVECVLTFNGAVRKSRLLAMLRLEPEIPFEVDGGDTAWTLLLARRPDRAALSVGDDRYDLTWPADLIVDDVTASSRGIDIEFTHALAEQDLRGFFVVDPAPEDLTLSRSTYEVSLRGSFPAGRRVSVTVKQGVRARGSLRLPKDVTRRVRIPDHRPRLRFTQSGTTLSTRAEPELEIEGVNVRRARLELRKVYPGNIVPLALRWARPAKLAGPKETRSIRVDKRHNEPWAQRIHLGPVRGVFDVRLYRDDHPRAVDRTLLQVTDLAPVVRVAQEGLVVFVARIGSGAAVAGARVVAYDEKNQVCASGATGADGIFRGRGAPAVVTVAHGDDLAYVSMRKHEMAHLGKEVEGRPHARGPEAFVYTDAGVVRPGGRVRVGVLVRTPAGRAAGALPVGLSLIGSDRRVLRTFSRPLSEFGFATFDIPFELDAPTGAYGVDVTVPGRKAPIGRARFRVEAFVPDRIEPRIVLPDALVAGRDAAVSVGARLLAGAPAAGLRARLEVRYEPVPAGDVAYGAPNRGFSREIGEVVLDENGCGTLRCTLPDRFDLAALFELKVIDTSGRAAFARASGRVRFRGKRLGLGRVAGLSVPVVAEGGALGQATAFLERLEWRGAYAEEGGRLVWRSHLVAHALAQATVPLADGRGTARFADPGDGRYRVRVRAPGFAAAARTFVRFDGHNRDDDGLGGAPQVMLSWTDGRLEVEAPFAGTGLLTVEGPGVLDARTVAVRAGLQSIPLPAPRATAPNVHATLTLVRGARAGGVARMLGAVAIPLERPAMALALQAPAEVLPGAELAVGVTTDRPADVVVHVVDEGVLRRTGHSTPAPAAWFAARRRLETRIADAYRRLLERMRFSADDPEPGGGAGGDKDRNLLLAQRLDPTARGTIETVALASRRIRVDRSATVRLALPGNYEGRVRVFAVAAALDATASADAPVRVKGPVSIRLPLPRAVAPGDTFVVPLEVDGAEPTVRLDGLEKLADEPLTLRALDRVGVARVVVTAGGMRREGKLSVRPPAPFAVRYAFSGTTLPGRWLESTVKARLTVGDTYFDLLPALERLTEYPYGCVEQTTSRAFPMLAWSELARRAHPDGGAPADAVDAAIRRLFFMQTRGGGLAVWPGGDSASVFGSVYAADFLLAARKAGRPVPADRLDRLLDAIERFEPGPYGALVLTRAGRGTGPLLDRLADGAAGEDAVRLAAAFHLRGDHARAHALLKAAGDPWKAPRETGAGLSSPVRAAATLLSTLAEIAPNDPRVPDLALRLRRAARRTAERTTQENAAALMALARLRAPKETSGALVVNGTTHRFDGPFAIELKAPWRFEAATPFVLRVEGVPLDTKTEQRGLSVRRELPAGPYRQGRVVRVVITGLAPKDSANVLVTDVLPGGFEIERARDTEGSLDPDRVDVRDDRVLFFRTAPLGGRFEQTYFVRAVTVGRFKQPPVRAELLYDPQLFASASGGGVVEVVR